MNTAELNTALPDEDLARFVVTFIVDGPRVPARIFAEILAALTGLLDEIHAASGDTSTLEWCVSDMLPGFSETTERQRIAVTLAAAKPGEASITAMLAMIEALRSQSAQAAVIPEGALRCIARLTDTLRRGPVLEMWVCRQAGVAGFFTLSLSQTVSELLARLPAGESSSATERVGDL